MDVVRLPDLVIDDFGADLPRALRPIIDTFWRADGKHRSPFFNEEGQWNPP
jgi:hypothetical protein